MIIDIHTHTFPERIVERAIAKLSSVSHIAAFTDGTDAGLKSSMEEAGIDHSVILSVATSPEQVRNINDSAARRQEERRKAGLSALGAMHPDFEDFYEELGRIREMGLRGIKLHPVYQGADLDDIRYLRIYDRCAELGLLVLLHGGLDIGFPGEDRASPSMALHALQELKAGTDTSFCVILAHMGGWRQWEEVLELAPAMLEAGPVFLDTAFSGGEFSPLPDGYWKAGENEMLDVDRFMRIVRAFGPERILFGTDSPWSSQKEALRFVRSLPLKEEEKNRILGENAGKLLGL